MSKIPNLLSLSIPQSFILRVTLFIGFLPNASFAQEAPKFSLGEEHPWGLQIPTGPESPIQIRLGTRLQTVMNFQTRNQLGSNSKLKETDAYIRRARLQVEVKYKEGIKFYMDVRNDNVNEGDGGEGDFNIGDAYIEVKELFGSKGLRLRAFRAKVDVSRSETVSSSKLLYLNRASIADEAAQYVSHNRRATNVQLLGDYGFLDFQVVLGDGVSSGKFDDASGSSVDAIDSQLFMYGSKVRFSVFGEKKDKRLTETYFGKGWHASLGAGYFRTPEIEFREDSGAQGKLARELINLEATVHFRGLFLTAEAFRFNGVVRDFSQAAFSIGRSTGFYVQGEYVFSSLCHLAPFVRYEKWDRFDSASGYDFLSAVAGINWYLKGNNLRLGLVFQYDSYDNNIVLTDGRGRSSDKNRQILLTSMWHY